MFKIKFIIPVYLTLGWIKNMYLGKSIKDDKWFSPILDNSEPFRCIFKTKNKPTYFFLKEKEFKHFLPETPNGSAHTSIGQTVGLGWRQHEIWLLFVQCRPLFEFHIVSFPHMMKITYMWCIRMMYCYYITYYIYFKTPLTIPKYCTK